MSFFEKIRKRKKSEHYRIERFGAMFLIISICLVSVSSVGIVQGIIKSRNLLSDRAIYTTQISMSKTETKADVVGVFASKDRKKAFVLFKFKDDSVVSVNAKNYQLYATGISPKFSSEPLMSRPVASIYSFGSTGYMGVYLLNSRPFPSQIIDMTIRGNVELVKPENRTATTPQDPSFEKYDQGKLYFNPGANGVIISEELSKPTFEPVNIYNEMVIRPKEKEVHSDLMKALDTMKTQLVAIDEYSKRLGNLSIDGANIVVPDKPADIKGDFIAPVAKDSKGQALGFNDTLDLVTKHVSPRGFKFEWQNRTVMDGFLDGLVADGQTGSEYLAAKSREENRPVSISDLKWNMTNGRSLDDLIENSSVDDGGPIADLIKSKDLLLQSWDTYRNTKSNFETILLKKLLILELDLQNVRSNTTVNNDDDAFIIY